mgnify:CR=1 FL=1
MVPLTGVEPVRFLGRGILSPLCLPIPPQRHICILKQRYFIILSRSRQAPRAAGGKFTRNSGREWWRFVKLSNKCTEKRHMIVELCRNMRYNEGKNSGLCGYLKKERKMLEFVDRVQFIGQRMMYDEGR